jgi:hypothetical protein
LFKINIKFNPVILDKIEKIKAEIRDRDSVPGKEAEVEAFRLECKRLFDEELYIPVEE